MAHEELQAIYALDVAEVGEFAVARWQVKAKEETTWTTFKVGVNEPHWLDHCDYRRVPGIALPKQKQPEIIWPTNAKYMATDANGAIRFYTEKPIAGMYAWLANKGNSFSNFNVAPNWKDTLVENPAFKLKKIDWSKVSEYVVNYWNYRKEIEGFPSKWIPWFGVPGRPKEQPIPDGLRVEYVLTGHRDTDAPAVADSQALSWHDLGAGTIASFRIIGISKGWEY